jgi:hypothetical protein
MCGTPEFAADRNLVKAIQGYKYADRLQPRKRRGQVTRDMLHQLCQDHPKLSILFMLIFCFGLRGEEARVLRSGDLYIRSATSATLTIVGENKRAQAKNAGTLTQEREITHPMGIAIMAELQMSIPKGVELFDEVDWMAAGQAVKDSARKHGWPHHVEFDGLHCLRHGGAGERREMEMTIAAGMDNGLTMRPSTSAWYSAGNHLR